MKIQTRYDKDVEAVARGIEQFGSPADRHIDEAVVERALDGADGLTTQELAQVIERLSARVLALYVEKPWTNKATMIEAIRRVRQIAEERSEQ